MDADGGYIGETPLHVKCPKSFTSLHENKKLQSTVRSRHEMVNKRFKQWGCLNKVSRHDFRKHADVFRAVAVITQLSLQLGEPLFEVDYTVVMAIFLHI